MIAQPLQALPVLRDEIGVYPGPSSRSGSPTWTLHDPVRSLYFSIDWLSFEILSRWHLGNAEAICTAVNHETSLTIDEASVQSLIDFLLQRELLKGGSAQDTKRLGSITARRKLHWYTWALHRYLFFRVPLWRPDVWLGSTLSGVKWLASPLFKLLSMLVLVFGLIQVSRQWERFSATLLDLFSLDGLIAYGLTIVLVKFLHELGHAYTAKHYGCRVPAMGVAFLVMFPMAYTDVNDVWRLRDKRQRLRVGAAGITTELILAAWATLAWVILPDGALRTAAFILATTTWVSTLLINASPFLRFDGYFLLMDTLELPNLHSRSFELARWKLRELLFSFGDDAPETFSKNRSRFLITFAWATWCYRLIVFTGIALLVYLLFPKPLGPLLAAVELYWFILKPIFAEISVWWKRRNEVFRSMRIWKTLAVLTLFALLALLPWDTRIHSQGVLKPATSELLSTPAAAQITAIHQLTGDYVKKGDLLAELEAPDLAFELNTAEERYQRVRWQLDNSAVGADTRAFIPVLQSELKRVEAEIKGLIERKNALDIIAPESGHLSWNDMELKPGQWVGPRAEIGRIDAVDHYRVYAYIQQHDLKRVQTGDTARFFSESGHTPPITLTIERIDSDATRVLTDEVLGSPHGGELLVRDTGSQLIPEYAIYRVVLKPIAQDTTGNSLPVLRGRLVIQGKAEAWATRFWRNAVSIFRRESGF